MVPMDNGGNVVVQENKEEFSFVKVFDKITAGGGSGCSNERNYL